MKTAFLLFAATLAAAPFDHPNYLPALPGPVVGEVVDFDTEAIRRQNPQYDVYFAPGLVGLFSRIPEAPIWTTLNVGGIREEPNFERWGFPGTGTPVIVPPPDRPHHPHWPPPPPADCPPDGPAVPEPAGSLMIAAGLIMAWAWRRR